MLQKVILTFGIVFVVMLFVLCGAQFIGMIGQWYALQNEAQFLARSQGKYGGYTTEANIELGRFVSTYKLDRSKVRIDASAKGAPVPWGTPVTASVENTYRFKVLGPISFDVPIKGVGRSVSTYLPGAYSVTYDVPRW